MKTMRHIMLLSSFIVLIASTVAVGQTPKFRIVEMEKTTDCIGKDKGTLFKRGYVKAREQKPIAVAVYLQHKSGYWDRKEFVSTGSGFVDINLSDCDYTGNYYAYATYKESISGDPFPDVMAVEMRHNSKDQTPKFRVVEMEDQPSKVDFKYGYVYSPSGRKVEVTFFAEKTDGSWKRKHFTYDGSGRAFIGMKGEDLTGEYKYVIQYVN